MTLPWSERAARIGAAMSRPLQDERILATARVLLWAVALAAAVAVVALLVGHARWEVEEFRGRPANGAFQLFNPLRRMAAGQTPGVDFQFFHGLGVPALHYPLFVVLGADLFASELARQLVPGLLFLLSTAALLRAWSLPWPCVALVSAAFTLAGPAVGLEALALPGLSLLGVRSTGPLAVAALAFALRPDPARPARFVAALSAGLGASLLLGTEQGLAACAGAAAALVLTPLGGERLPRRALLAAAVLLGGLTCYVLLLLVLTGGHPLPALRHAFLEVLADQAWYFGAPPNVFVERWGELLEGTVARPLALGLFFFAPAGVALAWRLPPAQRGELGGYVLLLVYGLASTGSYLGIASPAYLQNLLRVEWLLGLYLLLRGVPLLLADRPWLPVWTPGLALVLSAALWDVGSNDLRARQAWRPPAPRPRVVCGIALDPGWAATQALLEEALGPPGEGAPPSVWSTYAGLLEARYGVFHPAEDYIIHALGPGARQRYVERFREARPRWVTTLRRSTTMYETWLQQEHWPFYEEVARCYDVRVVTGHGLLWERRPDADRVGPAPWDGAVAPAPGALEVALPAADGEDVLVVEVEYRVENARSFVPVLGRLPRYLLAPEGAQDDLPVSLPPYESRWTFAVHRRPGVAPRLRVDVRALLGGPRSRSSACAGARCPCRSGRAWRCWTGCRSPRRRVRRGPA